jgi:hypothetical protein
MSASERPTVLQQALELIRRRELRVLGPLPRQRRRRPAVGDQQMTLVKSSNETITKADASARALLKLLGDPKTRPPRYRRFILVRRETGQLEFEQDELEAIFDEVLAEACGRPKPRPRVIRIDPQ